MYTLVADPLSRVQGLSRFMNVPFEDFLRHIKVVRTHEF